MIYNYERLLRQVTYTNRKPAYYLNRQFKIACSELNGRFVSNEYVQTVSMTYWIHAFKLFTVISKVKLADYL